VVVILSNNAFPFWYGAANNTLFSNSAIFYTPAPKTVTNESRVKAQALFCVENTSKREF